MANPNQTATDMPENTDTPTHSPTPSSRSDSAACSPSSIYLQWHGDSDDDVDEPLPEENREFVTWCEDKVFTHDIRYVRWDMVERVFRDILDAHGHPDSSEYQECDTDPCQMCEWIKELHQANDLGKVTPL